MATWIESVITKNPLSIIARSDLMDARANFSTPLINLTGEVLKSTKTNTKLIAGIGFRYNYENENVSGLVISVGGNGSIKTVPKKSYYWHL